MINNQPLPNNQNFNIKSLKKLNIGLIVGVVVAIVAIIAVIILLNSNPSSENKLKEDPTVSSASFEQSGDHYVLKDINSNNENQVIIYKNNGVDRHSIIYNNGKKSFETISCLNVAFVNDEVRCLIQNGGVFEYYDIDGNKINK